ncbi:hypothetical protein ABKV19_002374 [Rosa sericea]
MKSLQLQQKTFRPKLAVEDLVQYIRYYTRQCYSGSEEDHKFGRPREDEILHQDRATVGSVHRCNLAKLRGFCIHGKQCFLVHKYMNRGSPEKIDPFWLLEWPKRYEITVGMARGLAYLRKGCKRRIIHCDIKLGNILLHHDCKSRYQILGLSS